MLGRNYFFLNSKLLRTMKNLNQEELYQLSGYKESSVPTDTLTHTHTHTHKQTDTETVTFI